MDTKQEAEEVAKLRDWVDDLRVSKPLEAPKAPTVQDPEPKGKVLKAPAELPEPVRRVNGIAAGIHQRLQEKARLIAEANSKKVEFDRATAGDLRSQAEQIAVWEHELDVKVQELKDRVEALAAGRNWELGKIAERVEKIDVSLGQLRKQLEVELGKLDPDRKVTA